MCSNIQIIYENNRSQLENCKNKFSDKTGTLYSIFGQKWLCLKATIVGFFLNMIKNEYPSTCSCDMQISNMCKTF